MTTPACGGYFPNKDAILVELLQQHLAAGVVTARSSLSAGIERAAPLEELVREVVHGLLALHREAPVLHHILVTRTPLPPDLVAELSGHERRLVDELAGLFDALPDTPLRDPKRAAAMAALAVNGIVHTQVATDEPHLDDATLVEEATTMVVAYLRASGG